MPFTPFHMGPGLLIKSVMHGSFSLMVFGWSQVLIDIQPLIVLLTGRGHLHGFTHTFVGATLIAIAATITGKYLMAFGLLVLQMRSHLPITWTVALISAFIGTYSHVLLDGIMHIDVHPFAPWSDANPFLGVISVRDLHLYCFGVGLLGMVAYPALVTARSSWTGRK